MDTLIADLRYAARTLARSPGFTLLAVLTLGLGIGANSIVFGTVNAMLVRPLPVERPGELVALWSADRRQGMLVPLSWQDYLDWRDRSGSFAGLGGHYGAPVSFGTGGRPELLWSELVTENYFSLLGLRPAAGRLFGPADDRGPGSDPYAVLAWDYWHRRFDADPRVVGTTVTLNGHPFTVVGVAPRGFRGLRLIGYRPDLWVPVEMHRELLPGSAGLLQGRGPGNGFLLAFGRMKAGRTMDETQAAASAFAADLARAHPAEDRDLGARIVTQRRPSDDPDFTPPQVMATSAALAMSAVALVLLVACTNVANLLLVRAAARRREIAVRVAIGASRARLVRQLLTESLVLTALGTAVALGLAAWSQDLQPLLLPRMAFQVGFDVRPDWRVVLVTLAAAVAAMMASGLAPALQASRPDVVTALKDVTHTGTGGRRRRRDLLVALQVAVSLVLLVAGGLFVRGLLRARALDLGIAAPGRLMLSLNPGLQGYDQARGEALYRRLAQRLEALPGVASATLAFPLPLDGASNSIAVFVPGFGGPGERQTYDVNSSAVGLDYFATAGTRLVAGRDFAPADSAGAPRVIVVNRTMAARFWPGRDPIGKVVRLDAVDGPEATVVGVAADGKYGAVWEAPQSYAYLPLAQSYRSWVTVVVRTRGDPRALEPAVRAEIGALDPDLPIFAAMTGREFVASALNVPTMAAGVATAFGALALLLAVVGIYGIVSVTVAQRTREVGIRVALGAARGDVLRLVLGRTGRLAAAGMAAGLLAALGAGRLLAHLLYGVSGADLVTFVSVPVLLALVVGAACWVPARRAVRVDPMVALRTE